MYNLKLILKWLSKVSFLLSFIALIGIIIDYGVFQSETFEQKLFWLYLTTIGVAFITTIFRFFQQKNNQKTQPLTFDVFFSLILLALLIHHLKLFNIDLLNDKIWLQLGTFIVFIREISLIDFNLIKEKLNPAQLFVLSFFTLILIGAILLMLPKSTYNGISFVDALFTSTSAVCVTGLIVVDTGTYFTHFGQIILIVLMQLGGLGIMTFASFFSYFFKGVSSYKNQLMLSDMTNSEKIAEVFSIIKKIVLVTFSIEAIGAILIFRSLNSSLIPDLNNRIFFSIFHTVSGFCNAGFSTLTNNLYEVGYRFNYPLHIVIAFLIIFGGIGFPIIFNFFKYLRHLIIKRIKLFKNHKSAVYIPWVININTKLVVITSTLLIIFGMLLFYVLESNHSLANQNEFGKMVGAFFGAVTPRTAGFNTINMNSLQAPTILLIIFLMWVGASPASTGGGIKTSTFAIATLNIFSIARRKNKTEIFHREIAAISIKRAFAVISLSLVVIGLAVFFIAVFDGDKNMMAIIFECFSAFSTVGLSLGITSSLTDVSKIILVLTMFIGRVGMLTLLISFLKKVTHTKYRHPTEEILIN
ncbi:KtrAB potassium uptake system, integral membrane component KtrB [hydrothermal vent metagenome]|uniref:KtrAB potassium uptake system, integral membrane component KtrB n=1 Tax=hydrothermal vent metagenome TaxID=652676 RepID=A0A3B0URJ0_9ZZZZ